MSRRLAEVEGEIHDFDGRAQRRPGCRQGRAKPRCLTLDLRVAEIDEEVRRSEGQISANRERIAAQESSIEHERDRGKDLDEEIERHRRQVVSLSARADDLQQQWRETAEAVETARNSMARWRTEGRGRAGPDRSNVEAGPGPRRARAASGGPTRTDAWRSACWATRCGLENQGASTSAARSQPQPDGRSRPADRRRGRGT